MVVRSPAGWQPLTAPHTPHPVIKVGGVWSNPGPTGSKGAQCAPMHCTPAHTLTPSPTLTPPEQVLDADFPALVISRP